MTSENGKPASPAGRTGNGVLQGLLLSLGVGVLSLLISQGAAASWFAGLIKPLWSLNAPGLALCTLLFHVLWGATLGAMWKRGGGTRSEKIALAWYLGVLAGHFLWALCFFALRSPSWGYVLAILVWLAILATMWTSTKYIGKTAILLLPCLGWVTFASTLNFHVLTLNIIKPRVELMDQDPKNQVKRFVVPRKKPEIKPETQKANEATGGQPEGTNP